MYKGKLILYSLNNFLFDMIQSRNVRTYLTIKIQAHEGEVIAEGKLLDSVVVVLIDDNVDSAMKRAKKLVKKKHYRLFEIMEYKDDKS